ncbi:Uncharacterised protein [Salmonella enterica subsp. enterica serovar Typhi]|nr:Uncharacterised protein [Salmonella enterica subsp. enterica serovar Typhi]
MMRGLHIGGMLRAWVGRRQIQHYADFTVVAPGAPGAHGGRVRQHGMVRHGGRTFKIHHIGIVEVVQIAAFHRHNRLVKGKPVLHAVAKQGKTRLRVPTKRLYDVAIFPAAFLLHDHRHIKMEQRNKRRDALRQ